MTAGIFNPNENGRVMLKTLFTYLWWSSSHLKLHHSYFTTKLTDRIYIIQRRDSIKNLSVFRATRQQRENILRELLTEKIDEILIGDTVFYKYVKTIEGE